MISFGGAISLICGVASATLSMPLGPLAPAAIHDLSTSTSAGLGGCMLWPPAPPLMAMASGGPLIPCSLPFLSMKRRDTAMESASISTSSSFIMQAEYCRRPSGERREPCGMTQVGIRRTSSISACSGSSSPRRTAASTMLPNHDE